MGPPTDDVFMGPLISLAHLDKVRSYVAKAREGGANIHCGETVDELSLPDGNRNVLNLKHVSYFA